MREGGRESMLLYVGSCLFPWFILKRSSGDKGILEQGVPLTMGNKEEQLWENWDSL